MINRFNKTSICSIIFLDIVGYSKKSVAEQIADKAIFNELITEAIKNVEQNDRIILDTGDGAAITLMGEPEEALFITLAIRDGILSYNKRTGQVLSVRIGINLGSVRVVNDINDRPNIVGDGINVAQRIMSFAGENEILVSRSYYEVTARLTKEMSGMFTYSGVKQDKHIREHEVYLVKTKESAETEVAEVEVVLPNSENIIPTIFGKELSPLNRLLLASMVLLVGFFALYFLTNQFKAVPADKEKSVHETVENNTNHTRTKKNQSVRKCSQAESLMWQCR